MRGICNFDCRSPTGTECVPIREWIRKMNQYKLDLVVPDMEAGRKSVRGGGGGVAAPKILILGVGLGTGNLGVSALLASTAKCILQVYPGARISLLEGRSNGDASRLHQPDGGPVELEYVDVQFTKRVWQRNHVIRLILTELLLKLVPKPSWRSALRSRNPYLKALSEVHMAADLTGGDSFSDIYGTKRLVRGCFRKLLPLVCGVKLVLPPQTYGPFRKPMSRALARFVLARASAVYARDREGLEQIRTLMAKRKMRAVPKLCPDVAFVLDAVRPDGEQADQLDRLKAQGRPLVGLNVSGLLYHGGYTRNNMFGLTCDYPSLVREIILHFVQKERLPVLLVPHVVPKNAAVENDWEACREVRESLPPEVQKQVIVVENIYDQHEVKYFVGLCDFFMGARMHSTIAALSQCVPAVGMAYSRKFAGVFQTAGMENAVIDLCDLSNGDALDKIKSLFRERMTLKRDLGDRIPGMKQEILTLFRGIH